MADDLVRPRRRAPSGPARLDGRVVVGGSGDDDSHRQGPRGSMGASSAAAVTTVTRTVRAHAARRARRRRRRASSGLTRLDGRVVGGSGDDDAHHQGPRGSTSTSSSAAAAATAHIIARLDRPRAVPLFAKGRGRCPPLQMGRSTETRGAGGGAGSPPIGLPRLCRPPLPDESAARQLRGAAGRSRPLVRSGAGGTGSGGGTPSGGAGGGITTPPPRPAAERYHLYRRAPTPTPAASVGATGATCLAGGGPPARTRRPASALRGSSSASPTASSVSCFLWAVQTAPPLPSQAATTRRAVGAPRLRGDGRGPCRWARGSGDAAAAQTVILAAGGS